MTNVTLRFQRVCPKRFLSLCYVQRKWCTYIVSRLVLYPNRPSIHLSLVTSDYHQVHPKWFPSLWYVRHKLCTYLATRLAVSPNGLSFHLSFVTNEYHQVRPKWFMSQWHIWRKVGTNLAPTLTLSPNGKKRDSTWPTSPIGSIGCVQNDFRAYGMFDANGAPILHQD
jgi:hypothetical protein